MLKSGQTCSFVVLMKFGLLLCFLLITVKCFSQEKTVSGIIFEKENKERVAAVDIRNLTTGISIFNSLKGEFKIAAKEGDVLVFTKLDYHPDTVKILNNAPLAVYMVRIAIQLSEVTVHDSTLTPEQRLAATKADYTKIYGSLSYKDFLTSPTVGNNGVGVGLSIDAIWNSLSRSGRNASRLREIIENNYEQNVIDYRFNRTYVGLITGLKDDRLTEFMMRYRPGYFTTKTTTDYEFVSMIRSNYRRFIRPHRVYTLPPLQPLVGK